MRIARPATPIVLTEAEREELNQLCRAGTTPQQLVRRARVVLLAADGARTLQNADQLRMSSDIVSTWRKRYSTGRLAALQDLPRPGDPRKHDQKTEQRILRKLDAAPPSGYHQSFGPFEWTKREVHRVGLKHSMAELRK